MARWLYAGFAVTLCAIVSARAAAPAEHITPPDVLTFELETDYAKRNSQWHVGEQRLSAFVRQDLSEDVNLEVAGLGSTVDRCRTEYDKLVDAGECGDKVIVTLKCQLSSPGGNMAGQISPAELRAIRRVIQEKCEDRVRKWLEAEEALWTYETRAFQFNIECVRRKDEPDRNTIEVDWNIVGTTETALDEETNVTLESGYTDGSEDGFRRMVLTANSAKMVRRNHSIWEIDPGLISRSCVAEICLRIVDRGRPVMFLRSRPFAVSGRRVHSESRPVVETQRATRNHKPE